MNNNKNRRRWVAIKDASTEQISTMKDPPFMSTQHHHITQLAIALVGCGFVNILFPQGLNLVFSKKLFSFVFWTHFGHQTTTVGPANSFFAGAVANSTNTKLPCGLMTWLLRIGCRQWIPNWSCVAICPFHQKPLSLPLCPLFYSFADTHLLPAHHTFKANLHATFGFVSGFSALLLPNPYSSLQALHAIQKPCFNKPVGVLFGDELHMRHDCCIFLNLYRQFSFTSALSPTSDLRCFCAIVNLLEFLHAGSNHAAFGVFFYSTLTYRHLYSHSICRVHCHFRYFPSVLRYSLSL